jgi:hypothetical protein
VSNEDLEFDFKVRSHRTLIRYTESKYHHVNCCYNCMHHSMTNGGFDICAKMDIDIRIDSICDHYQKEE